MARQRRTGPREAENWLTALAVVGAGLLWAGQGGADGSAEAGPPSERLVCTHPFSPDHPAVTGFLEVWAHGVRTDSGGALNVEMRADPESGPRSDGAAGNDAEGDCAVVALTGPAAEVYDLPFVAQRSAEAASATAWQTLAAPHDGDDADDRAAWLAVFVDTPSGVILSDPDARPLPGALGGLRLRVPAPGVGEVLGALGASVVLPSSPDTAVGAVAPLSTARGAAWLLTVDGDRSLHSRAYALQLAPGYLASRDAATRAILLLDHGEGLSRRAGRAIDRSVAVTLEHLQGNGQAVPLAEDAVGVLLSRAAALHAEWATTEARKRLLDSLAGTPQPPREK